ncbi:MAG: tetratricopeptide repeat protein [Treponema sp.]|jgi:tetratricopeptide (TPR) repeat protein|nr:tetratricopeptide repeat protein [Treponema sp.]
MPSLNALAQFKNSFSDIAGEKNDLTSKQLPIDDLALPSTEAPPFEFTREEASFLAAPSPSPDGSSQADATADLDDGSFFDMPGDAPPPLDTGPGDAISALDGFLKDFTSSASAEETAPPATDDFSVDDMLSGLSDEPPAPADSVPEEPSADLGSSDFNIDDFAPSAGEEPPPSGIDDFSVPDGLLSGLTDEMESAKADVESPDFGIEDFSIDEPAAEDSGGEENQFDDMNGAIDMGGESPHIEEGAPAEPDSFDLPDDTSFDMPDESSLSAEPDIPAGSGDEDLSSFDDLDGSIDMGGESPHVSDEEPSPDFSMDGLSDSDFSVPDDSGFGSELPDTDFSVPDDSGFGSELPDTDFSVPEDSGFEDQLPDADFSGVDDSSFTSNFTPDGGETDFAPSSGDDFAPMGDLGDDFASDSIDLDTSSESSGEEHGTEEMSADIFGDGDDDFSLSGLDDILNKSKGDTAPKPPPKKGFFGRRKAKAEELPEAEEGVDEISLSQDDVNRILRTLSSYPLNLRIVCEELIAEQVILPQQLSKLIRYLVNGASVKETAALAEEITGKPIVIPRSFEKSTGAAFEAEQSSFAYIFVHNFLPVLRFVAIIAALLLSVIYLSYKFIYTPIVAENLYKRGYERIPAGEYERANELFHDAFTKHRKKKWFYAYAEAFRDQRRYMLAEAKYDELLRYYPRDKKGVLDYAALNTYYLMNYEKANRLLQREILDYAPKDYDALVAAGDNFLAWADSDPSKFYDKYEDARFCYARLLENYGWQVPLVERMLKYFIRTDDLRETLQLRVWFENDPKKRKLSADSLAELGGYLLDKQLEKPVGVPNPYVESIESVRAMLLQAISLDPYLPEAHYHLARYHHNLGNTHDERLTLENAIRAFDLAKVESVRRRLYRVDAHFRYANLLVDNGESIPVEENLVKGIELYEDFLSRNLIPATPQLGQLYAAMGDLELYLKLDNMEAALTNYRTAESYGYAPPEVQYRMGTAYYSLGDWRNALDYLFKASAGLPLNRRMLFALGNTTYQRGDYFAAQGYFERLLDILESQRVRLPVLMPNDNMQFIELAERLMMARNNIGAVYEALADQTGRREYRSRALAMYAESSRAWDMITRNPESMVRSSVTGSSGAPGINYGYINASHALRPTSDYSPQIFVRIDKDVQEPSRWEELAPFNALKPAQ